jgi:Flp pilus assembly protein TadB
MKNLFKLSTIYFALFAFVLVLASCSKRDLTQSSDNKKLEKLSAELENNTASISLPKSDLATEELKSTEVSYPVSSQSSLRINDTNEDSNTLLVSSKTRKATKNLSPKQERKLEIKKAKAQGRGGLSQRMKIGIILAAVGLLVALLIGWPIYIIGVIVFIIGVVLIIMDLVSY